MFIKLRRPLSSRVTSPAVLQGGGGFPGAATPYSFHSIAKRTGTALGGIYGQLTNQISAPFNFNATELHYSMSGAGSVTLTGIPDNTIHAFAGVMQAGNSLANWDGNASSNAAISGSVGAGGGEFIGSSNGFKFTGDIYECAHNNGTAFTAQEIANIVSNCRTYYNF